jgi:hypothetical protein
MFKLILFFTFISFNCFSLTLEDYLPKDTRYDSSIPTPKAVTGIEVGQRHYRHDQIIQYLSVLAASSNRARIFEYGQTNEGRRLVLLFISSEQNMIKFERLHESKELLKVWNGFSVHGDEASGANASVLYAYHLAAGHSEEINKLLDETLIIIDPTINPDGYDRFVNDVNSMRGIIDTIDANDASHQQATPDGRTNHYWFDLNRDWLLLSQVESKARIKQFHKWQPHVLDDHHEMGSESSFFFQPGVPERTNPLIPAKNIELTNKLARFHAKTLTDKGASFFTKESYDDFYPGKGSTYPDLQGSVGILFEQASANGGVLETKEGMKYLTEGVDNQFRTAISTLKGAYSLKDELLQFKQDFFNEALNQSEKQGFKGYVFDFGTDKIKASKFVEFMNLHEIQVLGLEEKITVNKRVFNPNSSLYIPLKQAQYNLIQSLMSTQTNFEDNTFYDVSSWNIAMAWGLNYDKVKDSVSTKEFSWENFKSNINNQYSKNPLAYVFNWDNGNAPAALNYLFNQNIKVKSNQKAFTMKVNGNSFDFPAGAIIIPIDQENSDQVLKAIAEINEFFQVSSIAITSGLSEKGIDLGSPSILTLTKPKVLMFIGDNINSYQAGSIWHLLDSEVGMALTKIRVPQLNKIELHEYTHLIMPSSKYLDITTEQIENIKAWIKQGGQIISFQQSGLWTEKNIQEITDEKGQKLESIKPKDYDEFDSDNAENTIGGAIVSAEADLTHPLSFGMRQKTQYVLLKGNAKLSDSKNAYSTPLILKSLAAGYMSESKQKQLEKASLVITEKVGKGGVTKFGFNPNFRGFWLGTQRWLINSIYFSDLIKKTELNN